jgi:hypothetical protein
MFLMIIHKVLKQLNLSRETHLSFSDEKGDVDKAKKPWEFLPAGHKIGRPEPLFKELVCLYLSAVFQLLKLCFLCLITSTYIDC